MYTKFYYNRIRKFNDKTLRSECNVLCNNIETFKKLIISWNCKDFQYEHTAEQFLRSENITKFESGDCFNGEIAFNSVHDHEYIILK